MALVWSSGSCVKLIIASSKLYVYMFACSLSCILWGTIRVLVTTWSATCHFTFSHLNKDLKAFALIPDRFIGQILLGGLKHISTSPDQLSRNMIMTKQSTFPSTPNAVNQPGLISLSNGCFFSVPLALQNYYRLQVYSFKADKSI